MRGRRNTSLSLSPVSTTSNSSYPEKPFLHQKSSSLDSIPSSPLLPYPVSTKENRPRPRINVWQRCVRILLSICILALFWHLTAYYYKPRSGAMHAVEDLQNSRTHRPQNGSLPIESTILTIGAGSDSPQWTVFIPQNSSFPLPSSVYREMCAQGALHHSHQAAQQESRLLFPWLHPKPKKSFDSSYLDIQSAEKAGILPRPITPKPLNLCDRSLTYVLDPDDASLGKTLLTLWLSYGFAKMEGRAFFVDDTRWAWGKYSSFFQPPPAPTCIRPASHYIVPYPLNAAHLVISQTTSPWIFGSAFRHDFLLTHCRGFAKHKRIYGMLREGYEALFHFGNAEDKSFAMSQILQLQSLRADGMPIAGMQIRRGDQRPFEPQYSRDYLPLGRYMDAAHNILSPQTSNDPSSPSPQLLIASDDPALFDHPDLHLHATSPVQLTLRKTQDRIQLATKAQLDQSSPIFSARIPNTPYTKHIDENSGWEGGFYPALFFSLGAAQSVHNLNPRQPDLTGPLQIPAQALFMRELVGRAYLLDLEILAAAGELGDGIVCAKSAATCRALAVMLGWDAVQSGKWVNVDGGPGWSWDGEAWWE